MTTQTRSTSKINGIDTNDVLTLVERIRSDPAEGIARFSVLTQWRGGMQSRTRIRSWSLGSETFPRQFDIDIDEPQQLAGTNTAANPQESLMAAMNACIMATWVAVCSLEGVSLDSLTIETHGELDLRGFLGLDAGVKPGYDKLNYTVRIHGDGRREQYERIADVVARTSPNYWNMANAIDLRPNLIIE